MPALICQPWRRQVEKQVCLLKRLHARVLLARGEMRPWIWKCCDCLTGQEIERRHQMARTKIEVNREIPKTRQELVDQIAELGRQERMRNKIENEMNEAITKLKKRYEEEAEPCNQKIKAIVNGVEAYCEVHRDELTDGGKTKTVTLPSGTLSWRKCPPSCRITKPEDVIAMLKKKGLSRFIRVKEEISKDLILAEPEAIVAVKGIAIVSEKEELSIEPFEVKLEAAV
ncbi:MAG TPA: host-nuclease inhibitor protein Gam [Candidatus Riflebacteria bacterium]|jgi:phage host-nuclease inhibitor protein Gam|nr:host-nuclease inhibitor protein Gam [Candidatus Riflebacteria bacterium]